MFVKMVGWGIQLEKYRLKKGWSIEYLSKYSGISASKITLLESDQLQFDQNIITSLARSFNLDPVNFIFILLGELNENKNLLPNDNIVRRYTELTDHIQQMGDLYVDIVKNKELILNNIEKDKAYYAKEWALIGYKCYKQELEIERLKRQLDII